MCVDILNQFLFEKKNFNEKNIETQPRKIETSDLDLEESETLEPNIVYKYGIHLDFVFSPYFVIETSSLLQFANN